MPDRPALANLDHPARTTPTPGDPGPGFSSPGHSATHTPEPDHPAATAPMSGGPAPVLSSPDHSATHTHESDHPAATAPMPGVMMCEADGPTVRTERDALDLIGDAWYQRAHLVAIPVERLHEDFWRLSTRVAGEVIQKFANYRIKVAVIGDISQHISSSTALRDWIREANRGDELWFLPDLQALRDRLPGEDRLSDEEHPSDEPVAGA
ncbi:DUF4180 domain-containing protein [Nonomuraea sp. NPDC048826]|uniref:DUF4180 domain-containing protein n=1 Tax=Nonomuraea sp. NPDC048826 TaxID=3364347 RepID=UPI0037145C9D